MVLNKMWNVIHRTHGGSAFLKKVFKKPLTYPFQNDILTKLSPRETLRKETVVK